MYLVESRLKTLISAFLFAGEPLDKREDKFQISRSITKDKFLLRLIDKINETDFDELPLLSVVLEEKLHNTAYEAEFIEILGATPLPLRLAKKIHDDLVKESVLRETI